MKFVYVGLEEAKKTATRFGLKFVRHGSPVDVTDLDQVEQLSADSDFVAHDGGPWEGGRVLDSAGSGDATNG